MTTHERQEPGRDLLPFPRTPAEEREMTESRDSPLRRHGKYDKQAEEDGGHRPAKDDESAAC